MKKQSAVVLGAIGANIRSMRERSRLSVDDLARQLALKPEVLEAVEAGQVRVSATTLFELIRVLGCSLGDLYSDKPEGSETLQQILTDLPLLDLEELKAVAVLVRVAVRRRDR